MKDSIIFIIFGATSSSEPMGAIKNGLQYAKDGKGASQATKDKYLIPWNTKEKSITGGGIFIGSSYIHLGQDTIYLQKFHVTSNNGGELFWHQYMTNVLAPYSESKSIYNGYKNSGLMSGTLSFTIPVYQNMPEIAQQSPNILESDYITENKKVYANADNLNIRTGPSTSYEVLTTVKKNETMTRIGKGKQSGELWDKVKLSNGIIGYAFQNYLIPVPDVQIQKINLSIDNPIIQKGQTKKLNVEILPEEAKNHSVEYRSSNTSVASVSSTGNITGLKSGKATITVKSKENSVSSSIDIQVNTPVTGLELNANNLILQVGDSFTIKPIFYPSDASNQEITYQSDNENIAQVNSLGEIVALQEGDTQIIATTKEGNIQKEISVSVMKKLDETEINFDSSLTINSNQISGWNVQKLKVQDIREQIESVYNIEIVNHQEELLTDNEMAGTGSKIRIIDEQDNILMEYHMVIYGDVNGDGKVNSVDLLVLQRHILEIENLKNVFLTAGNVQKNGKNPSSVDSLLIQRHILSLKIIEQ